MSKAWLLGGAVFLGALLLGSVIVALLDEAEPLAEGTPEAAVQRYLTATEDQDYKLAYGLLSATLRDECTLEQFYGGSPAPESRIGDSRITLEETRTVDDTAFVTVRVAHLSGGGPFGTEESSFEHRFTLKREAGEWRLSEYPWPYFQCGSVKAPRVIIEEARPRTSPTPTPAPVSETQEAPPQSR
jgi:hypothetical protein